jgi:hypothetical protein
MQNKSMISKIISCASVILFLSIYSYAQQVRIQDLSIEQDEKGFLVKGTIIASGLNPKDQIVESDISGVVADIQIGPGAVYPVLPEFLQIRPYGMKKGGKMLTSKEIKGHNIKTVSITGVVIRPPTVWRNYGGLGVWRDSAPDTIEQDFSGRISKDHAGKMLRIRVQLTHEWGGPYAPWSAYAYFHDIAFEGVLEAKEKKNKPPTVSLSSTPQDPEVGDRVTVAASASDPDGDPLTFTWFVNGVQKSSHDKSLFFDGLAAGKYIVEVIVSDGQDSATDKLTFRVQKKNDPPTVSPDNDPKDLYEGDSVTLTANAKDPNQDPLVITWYDNSGNEAGKGETLRLSQLKEGTYSYKVTADDGKGGTASGLVTFHVKKAQAQNKPPSCVLSFSPVDPVEGDTVIVSASASDPDGDPLVYSWSINQGASQQGSVALTVSNAAQGTYNVKLDVSDGKPGGNSSCFVSFVVKPQPQKNRPPELNPDFSPALPRVGDTVTVNANGSDPDGDPIEYTYIHNGKVIKSNTTDGFVEIPEILEGAHTIEIIADDGNGGRTQRTVSFTVECDCQDWRVTELIVSDDNPMARDVLKIWVEIHNRCWNRIECPVTITVNGVVVFNENLSVKAEDEQRVTVEYCLPVGLGGSQVPVRAQVGNDFRELMISVKRETPTRILGTVLEVGTLDAVAGATVIARPKSIVNPSGIAVNASQTFQASVRNDGHYTIDVDLFKAVDPSARTPEMECSILVVEFDVTVDERPEYLGPSFGMMDCGKGVDVKRREDTTIIDFRLVPKTGRDPDIIFSYTQMRNGKIKEHGGPINQLELPPGTYEISVGGGKQTYVTLSYVLSGDPGTQLVIRASIDENCQSKAATLVVPAGQRAQGFQFQIYSTWMPCQGPEFPDSIGFVIKRQ